MVSTRIVCGTIGHLCMRIGRIVPFGAAPLCVLLVLTAVSLSSARTFADPAPRLVGGWGENGTDPDQFNRPRGLGFEGAQGRNLGSDVAQVGGRDGQEDARKLRSRAANPDELSRVGVRERPEEHTVEHAEDCRVHSDGDSQREQDHDGEQRAA